MPEWGERHTTLEMIVQELQRPVRLDETFERRVMVRVRRLHAERRSRGWIAIASRITHRPGWAAALAASVVAVVTLGLLRGRPAEGERRGPAPLEPVQFVLVAPDAHSVAVVGDFNDWGLNDGALIATNHEGVWSVTAPVPAGVHRYAFLVNGKQWVADPSAPRASDDDFGMPSSALVVEDSTR
ncbi:MAG TPA: isoamylase early set domain-containing protein [Gemmatimonadaceae bacterium]|nr:isoamylase early set domain-containing protein [Gemmatimonadaceae bacterium]